MRLGWTILGLSLAAASAFGLVSATKLLVRASMSAPLDWNEAHHTLGRPTKIRNGGRCGPQVATWSKNYERRVDSVSIMKNGQCIAKESSACDLRIQISSELFANENGFSKQITRRLNQQLKNFDEWPVGKFDTLKSVTATWKKVGLTSFLRVVAKISFEKAKVYAMIDFYPEAEKDSVKITTEANLDITFNNGLVQWVSDMIRGNRIIAWAVDGEIDKVLSKAFGPIPSLELGDGHALKFRLCPRDTFDIGDNGEVVALMAIDTDYPAVDDDSVFSEIVSSGELLQLDISQQGLNAIMHELTKSGFWSQQIDLWDIPKRFSEIETVRSMVSVRLGKMTLLSSPDIQIDGESMSVLMPFDFSIKDGVSEFNAKTFFDIDLTADSLNLFGRVDVEDISVTCESKGWLLPCYGGIVHHANSYMRDLGEVILAEVNGWLSAMVLGQTIVTPGWGTARFQQLKLEMSKAVITVTGIGQINWED